MKRIYNNTFRNRGVTEATYFKQLYIRVAIVAGNLRINEDLLSKYDLTRLISIERTSENLDKEFLL